MDIVTGFIGVAVTVAAYLFGRLSDSTPDTVKPTYRNVKHLPDVDDAVDCNIYMVLNSSGEYDMYVPDDDKWKNIGQWKRDPYVGIINETDQPIITRYSFVEELPLRNVNQNTVYAVSEPNDRFRFKLYQFIHGQPVHIGIRTNGETKIFDFETVADLIRKRMLPEPRVTDPILVYDNNWDKYYVDFKYQPTSMVRKETADNGSIVEDDWKALCYGLSLVLGSYTGDIDYGNLERFARSRIHSNYFQLMRVDSIFKYRQTDGILTYMARRDDE